MNRVEGSLRETNPLWAPIEPAPPSRPRPPASGVGEIIDAYQRAERPVRLARSQRYSLVLTEPCPDPVWRRA